MQAPIIPLPQQFMALNELHVRISEDMAWIVSALAMLFLILSFIDGSPNYVVDDLGRYGLELLAGAIAVKVGGLWIAAPFFVLCCLFIVYLYAKMFIDLLRWIYGHVRTYF